VLTQLSDTAAGVTDETHRRHLSRICNTLLDMQPHRMLIVVVLKTAEKDLHLRLNVTLQGDIHYDATAKKCVPV
jgi:hypothetical protein